MLQFFNMIQPLDLEIPNHDRNTWIKYFVNIYNTIRLVI